MGFIKTTCLPYALFIELLTGSEGNCMLLNLLKAFNKVLVDLLLFKVI